MKVKIISVHNHGDVDKEYVLLEAKQDCDIGRYLLADSSYTSDGKVSNKLRHMHWFPDKPVKQGDLVSLWSKGGKNITTETKSGTPIHRFFWGLKTAVWNDNGDCAAILELNAWQFIKTKD